MDEDRFQCVAHPVGFDTDCPFCAEEVKDLQTRALKITQRNQAAEYRIQMLGQTIDIASVVLLRLNTLLGMITAGNPKQLAIFELLFTENCEISLQQTEAAVNRARLMIPGHK